MLGRIMVKVENLYMTKSLSNKLYLKKQLYSLRIKEDTPIFEHMNIFNKIVSDLLCLEVKLEEEGKTLILLAFLTPSYDHLVTIIMYGIETLKTEEVKATLLIMRLWRDRI